ncbi:hypothetical protein [Burkholderia dolosa]|uniref:hypothetical protein n=1 Tax=Burkholderia dolosa TaxID=152500 RepID=UPI001B95C934|nr:hypothetical protein [Burkholderia dolosa]MBR8059775.1 hypothetical protein [Burkholderia dolosa]
MRTQHIRLDAGQSHFAWLDKGSRVVVLDGTLAVTLRQRTIDWLPDAPHHVCRVLDEGECLTIDTAGHVVLSAQRARVASVMVVAPAHTPGMRARCRAILRRLITPIGRGRQVGGQP